MKFSSSHVLLAAASTMVSASAILMWPESGGGSSLVARNGDGNSMVDSIWIDIDCTGGAAVCNADCMAILCFGAPNPVQLDSKNSTEKRAESGYSSGLLRTTRVLGSEKAYISENMSWMIGIRVHSAYQKFGVTDEKYFMKWSTNFGMGAPYCSALQGGYDIPHTVSRNVEIRPDHSIYTKKNKPESDPIMLAITRLAANSWDDKPTFHMMEVDAVNRWHRYPWGFQGSMPSNDRTKGGSLGFKREEDEREEQEEEEAVEATNAKKSSQDERRWQSTDRFGHLLFL
ncbi:hypothetical protein CC78DRAFT_543067 [Lojkania enalia]|uniref:Uncharacterized protein n=1 Tax=Lojkania enalia TaxID=147567 RepID=A0A9P4KG62_9PLEO|nr:hypothetical protein CC78DRAFT_543067 [Didymosphaeria enalia]